MEKQQLINEACEVSNSILGDKISKIQSRIQSAERDLAGLSDDVWLKRKRMDLKSLISSLTRELQSVKDAKTHTRKRFEETEKKYSNALDTILKTNGTRLVSSSIYSATKTFRRSNVVLMSKDNAEECIRQHLRSELGLQETPLMLTAGDICDNCSLQMTVVSNDSMLSCPKCHKVRLLPNTMTTSALHGTEAEANVVITKHRLPEWIEMAQAKEFAEPSPEISMSVAQFLISHNMTGLEQYASKIAEERNTNGPFVSVMDAYRRLPFIPDLIPRLKAINASNIRTALKGLVTEGKGEKFRKFYERSAKLGSIVSGFFPPRMTGQQEELLRMMYTTAAPEYEKRRKPKQTYWPGGFPFFLRCACVLLGWDEFASQFPIPTGSKEGNMRDLLRNEIWTELGWEIVPYTGKLSPITLADGSVMNTVLDNDEIGSEEALEAKTMQKDVEAKMSIKKRRRLDFDLECS